MLAAGAGRRYGTPKVLVEGWLDTAVRALADGGCDRVAVVLGAAPVTLPDGVTAVSAPDWQQGLSASVRAALNYAEGTAAEFAVLHLVDTPDVGAAVVARVLQGARAAQSGLARAFYAGAPGHPVVLARAHWPAVIAGLHGDRGAGPYLRAAHGVAEVDCADLASGRDHDQPER